MTETQNQTGTKKKLLIPVVVLMLLGVGLVGAAYAYSSSVTINGNHVDSESFVLEVKEGNTLITGPITVKGIDFTTDTVLGTDGVDVVANTLPNNGYVGKLIITDSDNATTGDVTMSVTAQVKIGESEFAATADGQITSVEVAHDASGGPIKYRVAVALYTNEACTEDYDTTVPFVSTIGTLYFKVTVTILDDSAAVHFVNATPADDVGYVKTALGLETFSLKFVANAPGTA